MTGLELLRAQDSKLPVIVFTGRGDPDLQEQVTRAGAVALLAKPVDTDRLLQCIEDALGGR